jgi:hypothetical protein
MPGQLTVSSTARCAAASSSTERILSHVIADRTPTPCRSNPTAGSPPHARPARPDRRRLPHQPARQLRRIPPPARPDQPPNVSATSPVLNETSAPPGRHQMTRRPGSRPPDWTWDRWGRPSTITRTYGSSSTASTCRWPPTSASTAPPAPCLRPHPRIRWQHPLERDRLGDVFTLSQLFTEWGETHRHPDRRRPRRRRPQANGDQQPDTRPRRSGRSAPAARPADRYPAVCRWPVIPDPATSSPSARR